MWVLLTLVVLGLISRHAADAQAGPAEVSLGSGQTVNLALRPREPVPVRVNLVAGQSNEIRIELPQGGVLGSFVKVLMDGNADPFLSDSGETFVRVPIADGVSNPVVLHVTALTNSKTDLSPQQARLSLTASASSEQTATYRKAVLAFNHGERLRRSHTGAEEAMASYQEALACARALHDASLEQRVLLSAGRMMMLNGKHYSEAVDLERQAVAVTGTDATPSVQAMAWKMLGGALMNTGDYAESVRASQRALDLYEKTGETYWQGIVLENLGGAMLNVGDLAKALATDERALTLSRTLHDDFGVVEMLAEIGSVHESRGEYQEALNAFSEAVEVVLPSSYNPMQGEAWLAMGKLHAGLGEEEPAASDFRRALSIAQHTASGLDELDALESIGRTELQLGHLQEAKADFSQGLTRARELKVVRPQSALLIGMAKTDLALAQREEAERLLRQAIELASGIHQTEETAEAYSTLGQMAEASGKNADADADFVQAAALYGGIPDKAGLADADASLARVEVAEGNPSAALEHLNAAMAIVEGSRESLSRGGQRTRYFAAQRPKYDQAVALLMDLDRKQPSGNYAAQAWMVAERARARSLLDELGSTAERGTSDPNNDDLRRRLAALEVKIRDLQERLAQTGTSAGDLIATKQIEEDLRGDVLAADELASRMRAAEPAAALENSLATPVRFASAELTAGDALLEYWTGAHASYVWVITSDGGCRGYSLPGATDLQHTVARYREALLARNEFAAGEALARREARLVSLSREERALGKRLGATLLPDALQAKLGGVKRLVVVADGALTEVPFASLRVRGTGKQDFAYLLERFEVVNEPSAAFLAYADQARRSPVSSARIAIFADPVYNLADARLAVRRVAASNVSLATTDGPVRRDAATADLAHLPRLPGSRQEALAIQEIVGQGRSSSFLGFAATPAAVRAVDWSQYSIAHFAAHAIAQPAGSDSAGILLSMFDDAGRRQDGAIWLRDIYQPHVARDLVVLSGCGTALGESIPGEGVNSLTRAFLFSGTRQVAATLWSADDTSAGALMSAFYRGLMRRGMAAPEALREAQLALLHRAGTASPYYWAGFIVEGSWKTR